MRGTHAPLNQNADDRPRDRCAEEVSPTLASDLLDCARRAKSAATSNDERTDNDIEELRGISTRLRGFHPMRRLTDRSQALAFWINVYNAMVIHGALHFRVRRLMTELRGFFRKTVYDIGGRTYNLDVIEHGLLRANRGHPMRLGVPQLMPWDARRVLVIRPFDPRIHFALNCGAVSCPPIRHYSADHIDAELDLAARSFVASGGVAVDPDGGGVLMSRIFLWYSRDFGWSKRAQLGSVLPYMDDGQGEAVTSAAKVGIRYAKYDWSFA
jgi:Protein of unknown function, DUF547